MVERGDLIMPHKDPKKAVESKRKLRQRNRKYRKRVKQFIQMSWVPEIPTENFCLDCWRNHSYMGPPCSIS